MRRAAPLLLLTSPASRGEARGEVGLRRRAASDGRSLVSASDDGTIRLWSLLTGAHLATLIPRPDGWAALRPDGRYKLSGDIAGAFWHVIGLVRFEPGELDPYLPTPLRIPDDEPLLPPDAP